MRDRIVRDYLFILFPNARYQRKLALADIPSKLIHWLSRRGLTTYYCEAALFISPAPTPVVRHSHPHFTSWGPL